jgi:hypothetical protein
MGSTDIIQTCSIQEIGDFVNTQRTDGNNHVSRTSESQETTLQNGEDLEESTKLARFALWREYAMANTETK